MTAAFPGDMHVDPAAQICWQPSACANAMCTRWQAMVAALCEGSDGAGGRFVLPQVREAGSILEMGMLCTTC
jgi:hypothetical protein